MADTKIEWATKVWNPVTGCSKVSPGCAHCYAEVVAKRFWGDRKFTDVQCHADRLDQPLHWRKPQRIFVNSMSDLFHEDVPFEFVDKVFGIMASAVQHTFMILTKRTERMLEYFSDPDSLWADRWPQAMQSIIGESEPTVFPLPNVWLIATVENQEMAEKRIPELLSVPAAVHGLSIEPMLGQIDLSEWLMPWHVETRTGMAHDPYCDGSCRNCPIPVPIQEQVQDPPMLDWVICGGESGPNARLMHPDWVRSLRNQCQTAGVPFFLKQMSVNGKMVKMPELDGVVWDQFPEVRR